MKYFLNFFFLLFVGLVMNLGSPMDLKAGTRIPNPFLAPTAVNDSITTCQGVPVNISILKNDLVNGAAISLDSSSVDLGPGQGYTLTVSGGIFTYDPSSKQVLFTPNSTFTGNAVINYTVMDNLGNISNSAKITVQVFAAPTLYNVTGGGNYCQGTFGGVGVALSGSDLGINYQLLVNGVSLGAPLAGTGASLDFGKQTTVGTYRVQAINPVTGCMVTMNSSATVNSVALPTAYIVGGGGIGCSSGTGAVVTLSNSDIGVNYQLQNGSILVGSPIPGTGLPLSFPPINSSSGLYVVTATNTLTSCSSLMSGSVVVTIYSTPTLFNVSGVNLCEGNLSNDIVLSGSQLGVTYQLLFNGSPVGTPLVGTSKALHFLGDTLPGTYRVIATNPSGCFSIMRNSAVISPSPVNYTLGPKNQNYCPSSPLPSISLSSSDLGVNYQLLSSGIPVGSPVAGTGNPLVFSSLPFGKYSIVAINASSGCSSSPSDTVTITADSLPKKFILNPSLAHYCSGSQGAPLVLSGSQSGVNYQLLYNGNPVGAIIAGTGNPLNLGYYPAGNYSVSAISALFPCGAVISDTASLIMDSLPQTYHLSPDTGHYCKGGAGLALTLSGSQLGVSYQLLLNNKPIGTSYAGTGSLLNFGIHIQGTYSVIAINNTSGCGITIPNNSLIIADSLPKSFTISPQNSSYCSGNSGVPLVLSGSETGINYQLMSGTNPMGSLLPGTGSSLNLGTLPQGNYSVLAINPKTGCQISSTDTAQILKDSLPVAYTLSPANAHYCQGDSGFHLSLNGSQVGVQYQVISNGVGIGIPINGNGNPLDFGLFKAGTYTVLETNTITHCSQNTNTSILVVDSSLKKYLLNPLNPHYCSGNGVDLILSGSQSGANYQLFSGINPIGPVLTGTGGTLDFGVQPKGTYYVKGNLPVGTCIWVVSDTTTLTKDTIPKNFSISGNHEYCPGTGGTVLTILGSQTGISYQIQNLSGAIGIPQTGTGGNLVFSGIPSGNYTILASSPGGCTAVMNSGVPFNVKSPLNGVISSHYSTCANPNSGSLHLSIKGGTPPYSILWNNNKTDSVLTGLSSGTYGVTIKDSIGCTITLSGTVKNSSPPITKPIQVSTTYNTPVTFSIVGSLTASDTTINLKTIDLDPSTAGIQNKLSISNRGQFQVDSTGKIRFVPVNLFTGVVTIYYTVQDNNGCLSDTSSIQVTVQPNSNPNEPLKFPTLFTPNGDGLNDTFGILGLNAYPNNSIEIFNRWGSQIFFAQSYLTQVPAWTGAGFGEGTYYYILKVEIGGVTKTYSGYIALIRSAK